MNAKYMLSAINMAKKAKRKNEVPVGAVIVKDDKIIASAHNMCEALFDSTAHAEMLAIKEAEKTLQKKRLNDCEIYVTLEPCAMCAGAIAAARFKTVVFGAYDSECGAVESAVKLFSEKKLHYSPEIYGGIKQNECEALIKEFFKNKRA